MFGFLFCRWRKASKCKKLLQQLLSRLKLLKNKKYAISRHLRHSIGLLIRNNDQTHALLRSQQLFLIENSVSIYDMLLHFTDFIILHFSSIKKHRKFLNDKISEAVSSLVFASARCGELPELVSIRELVSQRYGQRYVTTALQLFPGHLVNRQIKEKLLKTSVSEDEKFRLLDEIGKETGHRFEMLRLEYSIPETETQVDEKEEEKVTESVLNSCSDDQSPEEVYKFSLTDVEEERNKELETPMEDDYIEEAQVGRDQRVFRFKESSEDERRSSSSSLSSALKEFGDMDSKKYYAKRKRQNHRRRSSPSYCYHIVYNVFKVKEEGEEEEQKYKEERHRRLSTKHVHPKLPDYDQIVAQFKALRKQQFFNLKIL